MNFFFGDVRKKNRPETRKIFTGCSLFGYPIAIDRASFRAWSNDKSGLGREPLMFARVKKRERRDKIFAETKHTILAHKKSNVQISLSERAVFNGKFPNFWPRKNQLLCVWEGITSKLACQCPSWGIYKHGPTSFWRKIRLLY